MLPGGKLHGHRLILLEASQALSRFMIISGKFGRVSKLCKPTLNKIAAILSFSVRQERAGFALEFNNTTADAYFSRAFSFAARSK
jgi:hypothetical protein